jgi:MFS family permease
VTVGSALPHLGRGLGLEWQGVIASASAAALVAAVIMHSVGDGPFDTQTAPFSWSHISSLVRHDGFRLATVGYVGHMWELYAMWTWVAAYLVAAGHDVPGVVFVVIASGAVGSWLAGSIADRRGRTIAAGGSLIISGSMILATTAVFHAPVVIMLPVVVLWGMSVVADSAQFSAAVTEVVGEQVRGTALALQTSIGFLITLVTIWLVPLASAAVSWRWAFLVLLPGPVVGVIAMRRLRRSRWAALLAGGRG